MPKKIQTPVFKTDEEVEKALFRLGEVTRAKAQLETDRDQAIAELRERCREDVKLLAAEMRVVKAALKKFASARRRTWAKRGLRSATFHNGVLGFRRRASLSLPKDTENFIQTLRGAGMDECVRVTEEPDKDALNTYDDAALESVGAQRVTTDHFYADPAEPPETKEG